MLDPKEDFSIALTTVGERTAEAARLLIVQQGIAENKVCTISGLPYKESVWETFNLGMREKRPWTIAFGGDLLLRNGTLQRIAEKLEEVPENVLAVRFLTFDKLSGGLQTPGNICFRTALIPQAMEAFAHVANTSYRPHSDLRELLEIDGLYYYDVKDFVIGVHDAEQFYRDIYRKSFVDGQKNAHLGKVYLSYLRENFSKDDDYRVALQGYCEGISTFEPPAKSCAAILLDDQALLMRLGLKEKEKAFDATFDDVERLLKTLPVNMEFSLGETGKI